MDLMSLTSLIESLPKDIVQCLTQTLIDDFKQEYENITYVYEKECPEYLQFIKLVKGHNFEFIPFYAIYADVAHLLHELSENRKVEGYLSCDGLLGKYIVQKEGDKFALVSHSCQDITIILSKTQFLEIAKHLEEHRNILRGKYKDFYDSKK